MKTIIYSTNSYILLLQTTLDQAHSKVFDQPSVSALHMVVATNAIASLYKSLRTCLLQEPGHCSFLANFREKDAL